MYHLPLSSSDKKEILRKLRNQEFSDKEMQEIWPLFLVHGLRVENVRQVGNGNKHLKLFLQHEKSVKSFDAIGFGMGEMVEQIKYGDKVDVVCEINLNEFNGTRKLELKLVDFKNAGESFEISLLRKKVF